MTNVCLMQIVRIDQEQISGSKPSVSNAAITSIQYNAFGGSLLPNKF